MMIYCMNCKDIKETVNLQTMQLPNLSFVHKGSCSVCGEVVQKKVADRDIVVDSGRHYPKRVFSGDRTPKKIIRSDIGQEIIRRIDGVLKKEISPENIRIKKLSDLVKLKGGRLYAKR